MKWLLTHTDKAYIPLLRIFLVFISLKELFSIAQKQQGYFEKANPFHRGDIIADLAHTLFSYNNDLLLLISVIFGLLSIVGFLTRVSLILYAILLFLRFYLENSFGIYNHEAGLTIQIIFVLCLSPGIYNWSLDRLIAEKFSFPESLKIKKYSQWSVKLILMLIVAGYVTAGVSKIKYGGLRWLDGQTLEYYLSGQASFRNSPSQKFMLSKESSDWKNENSLSVHTYNNFQSNENFLSIGRSLASSKSLMSILSILTVCLEIGAVFLLFSKEARNFILFSAIIFHFSIRFLMGLGFLDYQIICACLIDWQLFKNQLQWIQRKIF